MSSYEFFVSVHLFSIYATFLALIIYLILTQNAAAREFDYIRRIRVFLPLFYFFLVLLLFTGSLLWALKGFFTSLATALMIFAWCGVFALSIALFVLFKKARKKHDYTDFRKASLCVISINIALCLISYLASYL